LPNNAFSGWQGLDLPLEDGPLAPMTMNDGPILERRPFKEFMFGSPLAALELAPLNPELGKYFATSDGVLVINVPPDSKLGLKPGDVVVAVDGRKVKGPAQLF